MKKILLQLLTMLALPIGMQADALRDSLPSNYGNWMNLTEGYTEDKDRNHQKMEVAIDGNTIHLSWVELTKQADNTYNVWYRRSLDLGKTWEDAKVIFKARTNQILNINSGSANRYMVSIMGTSTWPLCRTIPLTTSGAILHTCVQTTAVSPSPVKSLVFAIVATIHMQDPSLPATEASLLLAPACMTITKCLILCQKTMVRRSRPKYRHWSTIPARPTSLTCRPATAIGLP